MISAFRRKIESGGQKKGGIDLSILPMKRSERILFERFLKKKAKKLQYLLKKMKKGVANGEHL